MIKCPNCGCRIRFDSQNFIVSDNLIRCTSCFAWLEVALTTKEVPLTPEERMRIDLAEHRDAVNKANPL